MEEKHSKYYYDFDRNKPIKDLEYMPNQKLHQNKDLDYMPDQKWHRYVSFAKSAVRIAGFILLPFNVVSATIVLILSEVIGIVEELV